MRHIRELRQLFTDALGEHGAAAQAVRHIRAELKSDLAQAVARQAGIVQLIERAQHGSRIGRAAGKTCRDRDALFNEDLAGLERRAGLLIEQLSRAVREVTLVGRQERQAAREHDAARLFLPAHDRDAHIVMQVDRLHHHFHQMIAVLALSRDVERQIDLRASLDHGAFARFLLLFPENHEIFAPLSLFLSQAARNAAFSPGTR